MERLLGLAAGVLVVLLLKQAKVAAQDELIALSDKNLQAGVPGPLTPPAGPTPSQTERKQHLNIG